jgi:hypothetical protein
MAESQGDGAWDVFFSYSHKDDRYRQRIDEHLSLLKRQGLIASWFDHKITAGKDLDQEIARHLERARIILLLVSSNFISSDYCFCTELARAIERHKDGSARVVPIIVKPCDWTSAPFGALKALPRDGKAITKWSTQDEAYYNIAMGIRDVVKELNANRKSPVSGGEADAASAAANDDAKASLSARLSAGCHLELLQQIGCPYLFLKLICTSKRPAKISRAELRIRGPHYIKAFQDGFGTDFGYKSPQGKLSEDDSLGFSFISTSPPNLLGGFKIERDEAGMFILPGLGFPVALFTGAAPADISVVVDFLDGRTETVLRGSEVQGQLSGLQAMCMARPYGVNPRLKLRARLIVASETAPDPSAVGTTNQKPVIFGPGGQIVESPVTQSIGMDVFADFPDIMAIGRDALQERCNEWLKTSIARQSRVKVLAIGQEGARLIISNLGIEPPPDIQAGENLYFPLDYLLEYLIERVVPADRQARLKAILEMKRHNGGPAVYQRFAVTPTQPLGLKCKNPGCGAMLKTGLLGYAGEPFMRDIEPVACPVCGMVSSYEPQDFFVIPDGEGQAGKLTDAPIEGVSGKETIQSTTGKGNQAVSGSTTGQNSPVLTAESSITYLAAPAPANQDADIFAELEATIPELLKEMQADLVAEPLTRDIIALKSSDYVYNWPTNHFGYFEDKAPGIMGKLRLLIDHGVIEELKPDFAYRITPRLATYLKNRRSG